MGSAFFVEIAQDACSLCVDFGWKGNKVDLALFWKKHELYAIKFAYIEKM
jgi:hypothetical protein